MLYRSMGVVLLAAALYGCGSDSSGPTINCNASQTNAVSLLVGGFTSIDQPCISFSANPSTTDTAEYLVVAHSAGGSPGGTASFQLTSTNASSSAAAAQMVRDIFELPWQMRHGGCLVFKLGLALRSRPEDQRRSDCAVG